MNKKASLLIVLSMSALMAGCQQSVAPAPTAKPVVNEVKTEAPKVESKEDTTIKVGSAIAAKYSDGKWYAATVNAVNGSVYNVKYDDGTVTTVNMADAKYLMMKPELKVGDKVMAVWQKGGKFYPGVVAELKDNAAMVKWDDGSAPSLVAFGQITKDELASTAAPVAVNVPTETNVPVQNNVTVNDASYKIGDKVAAAWMPNTWWYATIKGVNGKDYQVDYADGTTGSLDVSKLKALDKSLKLVAGDKVMAVWGSGKFYAGVVQSVESTGAMVKWEDGSAPSLVEFGQIYKQ